MASRIPRSVAGWDSIFASLKLAWRFGGWRMFQSLFSKNVCKSCALGMGGQQGGMRNEKGAFPSVCKKSFMAQASDQQAPISDDFFTRHSVSELSRWTPQEMEYAGRLVHPLLLEPGSDHYRPITWEDAMDRLVRQMSTTPPERMFFYASGRSSNEAGFLLQLMARDLGTNNVNNCSYYCHQASGVGLTQSLGTGTATLTLEDLEETDLIFIIGANPASNHPRFMGNLLNIRRSGGEVVVINPARERGLENFSVPSDWRSLLFGSEIASQYIQPHIGGDVALFQGMAKALFEMSRENPAVVDEKFIENHTEGFQEYRQYVEGLVWLDVEIAAGVPRTRMVELARLYARAENVVFAWAMGITHHAHGVENVQSIVNLSLLRGMVGRAKAGLVPLRGHSNVQGIGSIGFTPQLKKDFMENLESLYGIQIPTKPGMDTLACMESARQGEFEFAWNLGGNLYGSNPDSAFAQEALSQIDFILYINTTLNPGHVLGRGKTTLLLPALARDEEPEPTTQESMFNFVRMSEGGKPGYSGPRSEVRIIAETAQQILTESSLPWDTLGSTREIRQVIGSVAKGFQKLKTIDSTHEEFHIAGRVLHEPQFPRESGRATFAIPDNDFSSRPAEEPGRFKLMTVRSEGQFNTVVYENIDRFRGIDRRDVILMNEDDIHAQGWRENDRVTVKNPTGALAHQILRAYPIRAGNIMMYYPEANVLVPRSHDPKSFTPSFKSIDVWITRED